VWTRVETTLFSCTPSVLDRASPNGLQPFTAQLKITLLHHVTFMLDQMYLRNRQRGGKGFSHTAFTEEVIRQQPCLLLEWIIIAQHALDDKP
jgi:hypothetical protein